MEVFEKIKDTLSGGNIPSPVLDGFCAQKFKEQLLKEEPSSTVDHIFSNAVNCIFQFRDPSSNESEYDHSPQRILCLGKVQSGKTSFFLGATALAFDNGYPIVYLLGGTKLRLKRQNLGRVIEAFQNNPKVKVFDAVKGFDDNLRKLVESGFKVIVVVLKNAAKKTNLGLLKNLAVQYEDIPSLIIDDEGDEYTPGADKAKKKNSKAGRTHDDIVETIKTFKRCTFLSVTATPQANLLVSTLNEISPDRMVLVQPGEGYTGGREFFDSEENVHVTRISDTDDFVASIPSSFQSAFSFFIFACALKLSEGDNRPFSMLVHPSSFSTVQNVVAGRIKNYLDSFIVKAIEHIRGMEMVSLKEDLKTAYHEYLSINPWKTVLLEDVFKFVPEVIENIRIQTINYTSSDYGDSDGRYKVKIGGNMLGRGLTIDRLIVSYIYRDSEEAMVDTMYQRCRWFGYKRKYFDVCRVYMTDELRKKFIAIVSSEDYMWNKVEAFLLNDVDAHNFTRVFELNHGKLLLTRKTVSGTVAIKELSGGHKGDLSIELSEEEKQRNRVLVKDYKSAHASDGIYIDFDNSPDHKQRHFIIHTTFTELYDNLLSKITYGYRSPFSVQLFSLLMTNIKKKLRPDVVTVMFMRDGIGEVRRPNPIDKGIIKNLLQGYNDGTQFEGDRWPKDMLGHDYSKETFIQIHWVKTDDMDPLEAGFPLISFNNPATAAEIKLVTGDNYYGN